MPNGRKVPQSSPNYIDRLKKKLSKGMIPYKVSRKRERTK